MLLLDEKNHSKIDVQYKSYMILALIINITPINQFIKLSPLIDSKSIINIPKKEKNGILEFLFSYKYLV